MDGQTGKTETKINYICIEELERNLEKYKHAEKAAKTVLHSTFDELHEKVLEACPANYKCVEPIALYHEVMWSMGLDFSERGVVRDELHHALEEWEYSMLTKGDTLSLSVDIERTSSDPPSAARPAALE